MSIDATVTAAEPLVRAFATVAWRRSRSIAARDSTRCRRR